MTLQQLDYIVALDNYRHFVTAAEKCFVSQPNLTMQVKKLEQEIGIEIFNREKKPLKPTPAGEQIILKARQILTEVNHLKEFVSQEKESVEGTFIMGVIPTLAPYIIPLFLKSFSEAYPNTKLIIKEMKTDEVISSIKNNMIDIALLSTPLSETGIREIPVYYEKFLFYHHKNDVFEDEVDLKHLNKDNLLLLNEGHCFREQALAICDMVGKNKSTLNFNYQSGSIETLIQLVDKGLGYSLIPEMVLLNKSTIEGSIKKIKNMSPVREISLIVHNNFTKEKLIDALHQEIKRVIPTNMETKARGTRVIWR